MLLMHRNVQHPLKLSLLIPPVSQALKKDEIRQPQLSPSFAVNTDPVWSTKTLLNLIWYIVTTETDRQTDLTFLRLIPPNYQHSVSSSNKPMLM